ncbi:hypothetical protein TUM4438_44660 [Shewanella sairae]|uniref:Uncharacterized protein n=1 Tax=Shewanella sairae TaxID=190310 RepID=A0ABQ4PRM1_9GAMM|nr:hypothetical protein [Shewanella sairae]MCL1132269.1 hypothetical protein [Shewanella sairae]GIU52298.1 hypothetical protein TUM4438_44660 [Shewanella sairae]
MAKNRVVQVPCADGLYKRLEAERLKSDDKTLAEVGRELWEFALMIKERSEASDARTNRELLEEILLTGKENQEILKQTYLNSFDSSKSTNTQVIEQVRNGTAKSKERAKEQVEEYMDTAKSE